MNKNKLGNQLCLSAAAWAAASLLGGSAYAQTCTANTEWVAADAVCAKVVRHYRNNKDSLKCTRNGVCPRTGSYAESFKTSFVVGGAPFTLVYDSARQSVVASESLTPSTFGDIPVAGDLWFSNFHKKILVKGDTHVAFRGNGLLQSFIKQADGSFTADADVNDRLEAVAGGFRYTEADGLIVEEYNAAGQLVKSSAANGVVLTYSYSTGATATAPAAGYLMGVVDQNGRSLAFEYTLPSGLNAATQGRLSKVTGPNGRSIGLAYKNGNGMLERITWEDGTRNLLQYTNTTHPWALTGVVDELDLLRITTDFDAQGAAIAVRQVGDTNNASLYYYDSPAVIVRSTYDSGSKVITRVHEWADMAGTATVTPASGIVDIDVLNHLGVPQVVGVAVSGGDAVVGNSTKQYDASGNVTVADDAQGARACMAYDTQNRMVSKVEGLASTVDCATVNPDGATMPSGAAVGNTAAWKARKTKITWHTDWRLPVTVTAPGSITTMVYHGQTDSLGSGTASCTSAPALPNGKPMPLLCKVGVQATDVTTGAVDSTVARRVSSFTYDAAGRQLTSTSPDGKTNTVAYYTDTSFASGDADALGHTVGDVWKMTDPMGNVTTYTQYDRAGRVREVVDARGIKTSSTYSARGAVLTTSVAAPGQSVLTTTNTYDATGALTSTVGANGLATSYAHDLVNRKMTVTTPTSKQYKEFDKAGRVVKAQVLASNGAANESSSLNWDSVGRLQSARNDAVTPQANPANAIKPLGRRVEDANNAIKAIGTQSWTKLIGNEYQSMIPRRVCTTGGECMYIAADGAVYLYTPSVSGTSEFGAYTIPAQTQYIGSASGSETVARSNMIIYEYSSQSRSASVVLDGQKVIGWCATMTINNSYYGSCYTNAGYSTFAGPSTQGSSSNVWTSN